MIVKISTVKACMFDVSSVCVYPTSRQHYVHKYYDCLVLQNTRSLSYIYPLASSSRYFENHSLIDQTPHNLMSNPSTIHSASLVVAHLPYLTRGPSGPASLSEIIILVGGHALTVRFFALCKAAVAMRPASQGPSRCSMGHGR